MIDERFRANGMIATLVYGLNFEKSVGGRLLIDYALSDKFDVILLHLKRDKAPSYNKLDLESAACLCVRKGGGFY